MDKKLDAPVRAGANFLLKVSFSSDSFLNPIADDKLPVDAYLSPSPARKQTDPFRVLRHVVTSGEKREITLTKLPEGKTCKGGLLVALVCGLLMGKPAAAEEDIRMVTVVTIETVLGSFELELLSDDAPLTVANFLNYVDRGDYDGSFFHRSVPGFVIQGGGFSYNPATQTAEDVPADAPVLNEFGVSNTRGTVAMAKVGNDPNSATNQWFVNIGNNSANLDNQNGGFTVFARVLGDGMVVVDEINALQRVDFGENGYEVTDENRYPASKAR